MPPSKPHACESCSELFPNKVALRRHRFKRHTLPPPFRKDGKVYKVVHNEGRLECPLDACSKAYVNRDDFQTHLRKAHGAVFEAAGNALGLDADEMLRRDADPLEFQVPPSNGENIKGVEHFDATHGQGTGKGQDAQELKGAGEASPAPRVGNRAAQTGHTMPAVPGNIQEAGDSGNSGADRGGRSGSNGAEFASKLSLAGTGRLGHLGSSGGDSDDEASSQSSTQFEEDAVENLLTDKPPLPALVHRWKSVSPTDNTPHSPLTEAAILRGGIGAAEALMCNVEATCEQVSQDTNAADVFASSRGEMPQSRRLHCQPLSQAASASVTKAPPLVSRGIQRSCSYEEESSYSSRVKRVCTARERRLASTKDLDKYMPALKGKCPYHFVLEGKLLNDDFPYCPQEPKRAGDYRDFKLSFVFEKYAYCYSCGMPQDRNRNGEGPMCHLSHDFRRPCPFGQFIFRTTFCLWQVQTLRAELISRLSIQRPLQTQEEFTEWAVDELADQGKYHNCLEAFLWFCRRREQENPRLFM
ncbi:hypothetical protein L210DRAFT_934942 [Boletus edulis BED1]|uniref:C2H2-type domain-containing protein n=1 Tax=Boletus edulis BED1 TaxID=1328754 RepID=A0AAD4BEZ0_BOLED|nr:hypothetical protein L210DRAFT_934942 [Boletus edulis BED1]